MGVHAGVRLCVDAAHEGELLLLLPLHSCMYRAVICKLPPCAQLPGSAWDPKVPGVQFHYDYIIPEHPHAVSLACLLHYCALMAPGWPAFPESLGW